MRPLNDYRQDQLAIIVDLLKRNTEADSWEYQLLRSCDFNLLKQVPLTGLQLYSVQKVAEKLWKSANVEQELKRYEKIK